MIWVQFVVCAGLIILTSSQLSRYGDVIAEKTGLGRAWIGAILIAGVTSLPSCISAVVWLETPNLAAGALLGSCIFNLMLIAVMDLAYQPGRVLAKAQDVQILSAGLGVLLLGLVAMGVLIGPALNSVGIPGIGVLSITIAILYVVGGRMIAGLEKERMGEVLEQDYAHISKARAYLIFASSAVAVLDRRPAVCHNRTFPQLRWEPFPGHIHLIAGDCRQFGRHRPWGDRPGDRQRIGKQSLQHSSFLHL